MSRYHVRPMNDLQQLIETRLAAAVTAGLGAEFADADPLITAATNPRFGDYQANLAMGLAKRAGRKPREIADALVGALVTEGLFEKVEIAGPGFINLWIEPAVLVEQVRRSAEAQWQPGAVGEPTETVVVDYSSPNVAKEMHIGHLRSTILGDAIVRVLTALGHRVVRQNHVGDWGTQFGMLIEHLVAQGADQASRHHDIGDLNTFYQEAKARFDVDEAFATQARQRVVLLQQGEEQTLALWRLLYDQSLEHFQAAYQRLGVLLQSQDIRGESAYNPALAGVVQDLKALGRLEESQGARVVYPAGFQGKEGEPLPMIVQKSDGGYLYATTDLAAARYRVDVLGADRVVYVTDARQSQHFAMVFAVLRETGWVPAQVRLDHVSFGTIMGADRKPFKTRSGGTVRLSEVIDEAIERAAAVVAAKSPDLSADQRAQVAAVVGIGALKYADLANDRVKDYVFDWDRMLALEGNTAPYLQYSYARIASIFRKGELTREAADGWPITVVESQERALALRLLQWPRVLGAVGQSLEPHRLCTYLYELASSYHSFYEHCPVLKAEDPVVRQGRLALCARVAATLRQGLGLLGIGVVERM